MICSVTRNDLLSVAGIASAVTKTKIMADHMIDKVMVATNGENISLMATDSEIFYKGQIKAEFDKNDTTFACLLPANKFFDTLRSFKADKLTLNFNGRAEITADSSKVTFGIQDTDSFPRAFLDKENWDVEIKIDPESLKKALRFASLAIRKEAVANIFGSVCFEITADKEAVVWATDGHRLHISKLETANNIVNNQDDEGQKYYIPEAGVKIFLKTLKNIKSDEITVYINDKFFKISSDTHNIILRLADGDLPDWRTVVNRVHPKIHVQAVRNEVENATKLAVSLFDSRDFKPLKLIVQSDRFVFNSRIDTDEINTSVKVRASNDLSVQVNADYLLDALAGIGRAVSFEFDTPNLPFFVKDGNDDNVFAMIAPTLDE